MHKEAIVQIQNISKKIGDKTIIDHLTFDIYQGEVFGFLGPNGAGKTTTIRMLVGLMSITEGEVYINSVSLKKDFEKAIMHVGGIVENPEMYKFLTGYQNLLHYARMMKGITKDRINEVIQIVGLDKRIHDKVQTYSLGMRQRLGLAQAILHSPKLLILDEPTNGLDPAGIRELRDYLRKIAREDNIAILVSSHLLSEMEQMCDRIGIIQHGKLIDVKMVDEFMEKQGELTVHFQIDPIEKTKNITINDTAVITIMPDQKVVELAIRKEEIPYYTTQMVLAGIKIYGIRSTSTLEDRFLEVTGGNEID